MDESELPPTPLSDEPTEEGPRAPSALERLRRRPRTLALALVAMAMVAGSLALLVTLWVRCGFAGCPNVDRLRAYQPGKAPRLLDRHGRFFAELRPVEGEVVRLTTLPGHVRDAFLAVEDRRFYSHPGVDWWRAVGAALVNLREGELEEGFSTVTMQLARNVFPERIRARERTLTRKLLEMRVAAEIEARFNKDEILELYLSHIYFGNGARGLEAAARHYFDTKASRLTPAQAALLAALIRGPSHYDPRRHPDRARQRRDLILTLMEHQDRLGATAARAARAAPLGVARWKGPAGAAPGLAPHFVEEVRRQLEELLGERLYDETLRIKTTLDAGLQRAAEEALLRQLRAVEAGSLGRFRGPRYTPDGAPPEEGATPYLQGAVLGLEAPTGDVLVWVGGRDFRHSRFDRVKSSTRQVGSAFKPFVYAAALRSGHFLSEPLLDEPIRLRLDDGRIWEPKNYDRDYDGLVSMREALVHSKNVPTVRLGSQVGLEDVANVAREAGIESEMAPTPALSLGTVAVSPLELVTAYTAFATLGEAVAPRSVLRVLSEEGHLVWKAPDVVRRRVLDEGVAYLVTNVLQDAVRRGTGGPARAAGIEGPVAGKTGTTNDATDVWFIGFTPTLVAGVWMGFDEPRSITRGATGGRFAAPVWGRMMVKAGRGGSAPGWNRPAAVVESWVDPGSGRPLAPGCESWAEPYRELFLRRTSPRRVCPGYDQVADVYRMPGEERPPGLDPWDDRWSSRPPPPGEYEEAQRRRREELSRAEAKRRREWVKEWERLRREWEKEQKRRRREREREWGRRRDGDRR